MEQEQNLSRKEVALLALRHFLPRIIEPTIPGIGYRVIERLCAMGTLLTGRAMLDRAVVVMVIHLLHHIIFCYLHQGK